MRFCFYCGEEIPECGQFCGKCGRSQAMAGTYRKLNSDVPADVMPKTEDFILEKEICNGRKDWGPCLNSKSDRVAENRKSQELTFLNFRSWSFLSLLAVHIACRNILWRAYFKQDVSVAITYQSLFSALFWTIIPIWAAFKKKKPLLGLIGTVITLCAGMIVPAWGMTSMFVGYAVAFYIFHKSSPLRQENHDSEVK